MILKAIQGLNVLETGLISRINKLKKPLSCSEKFRLAPSAEHKAELSVRIAECNTLATELAGRYQEFF